MSQRRKRNFRAQTTAFLLEGEEDVGHGSWAISYGDMVTLLLSFFVLSYGGHESKQVKLLEKSLAKAGVEAPTGTAHKSSAKGTGTEVTTNKTAITQTFEALSKMKNVRTIKDRGRLVADFSATSFFDFRKTELSQQGKEALERFAKALAPLQAGLKITVIGYTDGTPVRALASNRYSDNLELSALRAVSAVRFLTSLGISRDKMRVGGDGEWKIPSPDNTTLPTEATAAAKAFSRRVVLLIETEESSK